MHRNAYYVVQYFPGVLPGEPFKNPYRGVDFQPIVPSPKPPPMKRPGEKIGRNEMCPCGSGKKFKHCCLLKLPGGHL